MDQREEFRQVVVLSEKKPEPIEGQRHAHHDLRPKRHEKLHLIAQVLGTLAPEVEVDHGRLPIRGDHLGAPAPVGILQTRLD